MSHSESRELIQAKILMEQGKFEEALQIADKISKKKDLSHHDKILYYLLKSSLSARLLKKEELLKYAEKAYLESRGQKASLLLCDVYIEMAHAYIWRFKIDKALDLIMKCDDLIKTLSDESILELVKREANIAWIKSGIYETKGEYDYALEYAKESLNLREKYKLKADVVASLSQIMEIYYSKGELDNALKYMDRCLAHAKEIDYKIIIQFCYTTSGLIYIAKGELKQGVELHKKALKIAEDLKDNFLIAASLNNLGLGYQQLWDFDNAQANFERSLELFRKFGSPGYTVIDSLFHLAIDKGDHEGAQKYVDQLIDFSNKEHLSYSFS